MLLALLGLQSAFAQDVLINEVLYDPSGSDEGGEWIELCNAGSFAVDLTDWEIEAAGTSFSSIFVFPSVSIAPGEYLLIGAGTSYVLDGTMQNGGDATDGVRLVDASGAAVDTLLYDEPNTNKLPDDSGGVGAEFAPDVSEAHSLARIPDCSDSDDVSVDFADDATPTPGELNVLGGGGETPESCDTPVRINEFLVNPTGADEGQEWLELYNDSGSDVDVSGWSLEYGASTYSGSATLPEGSIVPAGAFLVVGGELVDEADVVVSLSMGNGSSGADAVQLLCADASVADIVVYGSDNEEGWLDESGELSTVAALPSEGASLGRVTDGLDTDDSAADVIVFDFASPGASNGAEGADCPGMDDVKLNELLVDPKGSDSEAMGEWVELYNAGAAAVDLTGWQVQFGTSSYGAIVELPAGTSIPAGDYLVLGEAMAPVVDIEVELGLGNASSNSDAVRLVHCGPGIADTVIYGEPNDDAWLDDLGEVATSTAPKPGSEESIQRLSDGYDTDLSGDDFAVQASPTPGEANPAIEPTICEGGVDTIKINELLPNPAGTDDDGEWVELYNAGGEAQRLDAWVIETATSTWGEDFVFPGGVELAPGEFLVVGGSAVPVADYVASSLSLGNAGTAPDGVRLVDCEGSVQDTVLYGDADEEEPDVELTDDIGFQSMAPNPDEDQSIGRLPDGADTDDNAADVGLLDPTPGEPNEALDGGGGGGGDDVDTDKGCGKSGKGSGSKCAAMGMLGGLEWGLLLLVAVRRRQR